MTYTLLTGATGLIGRYLLQDLASCNTPTALLVRGDNAAQRIESILHDMPHALQGRSLDDHQAKRIVIQADLHQEDLGLSPAHREWISQNVSRVIHCAGDVNFHSSGTNSSTWETNVNGSLRLGQFCKSHGIEDFSYVSTAFVCGDRSGTIYEDDLDCGQAFASIYEESKYQAELLLHRLQFRRLNVFRPCFVSGDNHSGYTSSYHGIYWFAQFTALAQMRASVVHGQRWQHPVRIFKDQDEVHHIIPVDAVSRAIVELHSRSDLAGGTYHLTPSVATSLGEVERALSEYFKYEGVRFSECVSRDTFNEMEALFYDGLKAIGHRYLDGDPYFDCTRTRSCLPWWDTIKIDHAYLVRIFDYAHRNRYGKGARKKRAAVSV